MMQKKHFFFLFLFPLWAFSFEVGLEEPSQDNLWEELDSLQLEIQNRRRRGEGISALEKQVQRRKKHLESQVEKSAADRDGQQSEQSDLSFWERSVYFFVETNTLDILIIITASVAVLSLLILCILQIRNRVRRKMVLSNFHAAAHTKKSMEGKRGGAGRSASSHKKEFATPKRTVHRSDISSENPQENTQEEVSFPPQSPALSAEDIARALREEYASLQQTHTESAAVSEAPSRKSSVDSSQGSPAPGMVHPRHEKVCSAHAGGKNVVDIARDMSMSIDQVQLILKVSGKRFTE
ncbi:MAG: hypothetical protein ACQEQ4_02930 [Fibrobacterota bacterium]